MVEPESLGLYKTDSSEPERLEEKNITIETEHFSDGVRSTIREVSAGVSSFIIKKEVRCLLLPEDIVILSKFLGFVVHECVTNVTTDESIVIPDGWIAAKPLHATTICFISEHPIKKPFIKIIFFKCKNFVPINIPTKGKDKEGSTTISYADKGKGKLIKIGNKVSKDVAPNVSSLTENHAAIVYDKAKDVFYFETLSKPCFVTLKKKRQFKEASGSQQIELAKGMEVKIHNDDIYEVK